MKGIVQRGMPCFISDGHSWSIRQNGEGWKVTCKKDFMANINADKACDVKVWDLPADPTTVAYYADL